MDDQLKVHDVTVSDFASFGTGSTVQQKTAVTYYVGAHGPFRLEYPQGQATADRIKLDIQQKVQMLREVTNA